MGALTQYVHCRAEEEAQLGAVRLFKKLRAGLEDRARDLAICRQRLTHLRRALEIPETAGASICGGPSPTVELVIPDGGEEIEWASKRFVETVSPEEISKLDRALQALVLEARGGLYGACQKSGDFIQELADPLVDQAAAFLGELLPVTDVAEFPIQQGVEGEKRLRRAYERAAPTVAGEMIANAVISSCRIHVAAIRSRSLLEGTSWAQLFCECRARTRSRSAARCACGQSISATRCSIAESRTKSGRIALHHRHMPAST